ncbi:MAG: trypsin-like peptidase domain-containing protein [Pirellulaceae bacterium]
MPASALKLTTQIICGTLAGITLAVAISLIRFSVPSPDDNATDKEIAFEDRQTVEKATPMLRSGTKASSPSTDKSTTVPTLNAETLPADQLFKTVAPAVISLVIQNEDRQPIVMGSGFVIQKHHLTRMQHPDFAWRLNSDRFLYVVTNFHVVESAVYINAQFPDGSQHYAFEVVAESPKTDLALLEVFRGAPQAHDTLEHRALSLADVAPTIGDTVFAVGSPKGLTNTISQGIISGLRTSDGCSLLQTTAAISGGSSGGPLLSQTGEVLGVTTEYHPEGQNLNFAVSVEHLLQLLNKPYDPRETWRGRSLREEEGHAFEASATIDAGTPADRQLLKRAHEQMRAAMTGEGSYEEAQDLARLAIERYPDKSRLHLAYLVLGQAELFMASESNRHDEGRIWSWQDTSAGKRALEYLETAAEMKVDFAPTHAAIGLYHASSRYKRVDNPFGNWPEELAAARKLVSLRPYCAEAHCKLGNAYKDLERYSDAIAGFEEALRLDPRSGGSIHYQLGNCYHKIDEFDKAVAAYDLQLRDAGESPVPEDAIYWSMGLAHRDAGRYRQALAAMEHARELGMPANPITQDILERVRAQVSSR